MHTHACASLAHIDSMRRENTNFFDDIIAHYGRLSRTHTNKQRNRGKTGLLSIIMPKVTRVSGASARIHAQCGVQLIFNGNQLYALYGVYPIYVYMFVICVALCAQTRRNKPTHITIPLKWWDIESQAQSIFREAGTHIHTIDL